MMKRHMGLPRYRNTRRRSVYCVLAFSILALALTVSSADANYRWCRTDPVVLIDGQLADIFVSAQFDDLKKVNGPTEIEVSTPVGVDPELAIATAGFGYGEKVRFAESESLKVTPEGIELRIKVRVPARDDAMPIRVEFAPHIVGVLRPAEAQGHANEWISLRTLL
jgi:hypothetical protein